MVQSRPHPPSPKDSQPQAVAATQGQVLRLRRRAEEYKLSPGNKAVGLRRFIHERRNAVKRLLLTAPLLLFFAPSLPAQDSSKPDALNEFETYLR